MRALVRRVTHPRAIAFRIVSGPGRLALLLLGLILLGPGAGAQAGTPKERPAARMHDANKLFELFRPGRQLDSGQSYFKGAVFIGSESCKACHAEQYSEWKTTWHARMEQWPSPQTVLGDFNDKIITFRDIAVKDRAGKISRLTFQVKAHKDASGFYFTVLDQDDPANNQTFKVAKTLGGKWDQGYEIQIGDNYFPAILRYSVKQGAWLVQAFFPEIWVEPDGTPDGRPRKAAELPMIRTAEAKCAGCHTTGFSFEKDKSGVWKSHGEGELGVGCEKCHGPASEHVKSAEAAKAAGRRLAAGDLKIVHGLKDLDHNQQTQLCAQCHGRATNRKQTDLAFPQGYLPGDTDIMEHLILWTYQGNGNPDQSRYFYRNDWAKRNRQQWQDFTKSTHFNKAGLSCLTCHSFHGKWEDMHLRQSPTEQCAACHNAGGRAMRPQLEMYQGSKMEAAGVRCIDCHMARIGYRSHLVEDTHKKKHYPMDGSSHIFQVATPQLKKQFGLRTACEVCHTRHRELPPQVYEWVMQNPMSDDELHAKLTEGQARIRTTMNAVMAGMAATPARLSARAQAKLDKARANADFVKLDGSLGFHNPAKAQALLDEALQLLKEAGSPVVAAIPSAGAGGQVQPRQARVAGAAVASVSAATVQPSARPQPEREARAATVQTAPAPTAPPAADRVAEGAGGGPAVGAWYVSREGDNLWKLSSKLYGAGAKYERIYKANAERMSSPHYLPPGTRLWLPH